MFGDFFELLTGQPQPQSWTELDPCRGPEVFARGDLNGLTGHPNVKTPNFRLRAHPINIAPNTTSKYGNWEFDFQGPKCHKDAILRKPKGETQQEQMKNHASRFWKLGYYANETRIHGYKKNLMMDLTPIDEPGHASVHFRCPDDCSSEDCAVGMHIGSVAGIRYIPGLKYVVDGSFYACPGEDPDHAKVYWRTSKYSTLPKECADVLLLAECAGGMWHGICHNVICCESAWNGNCTGPAKTRFNGD